MKHLLPLSLFALLTACSSAAMQPPPSPVMPALISQLGMAVDAHTSQVEVHLTVKSEFPRTLKTLRVFVAIYDQDGTQIGLDEAIEILGPIKKGQSIGPLEKITSIRDTSARCVDVTRVEAVMMDYATRIASGNDAHSLIMDPGYKGCARRAR